MPSSSFTPYMSSDFCNFWVTTNRCLRAFIFKMRKMQIIGVFLCKRRCRSQKRCIWGDSVIIISKRIAQNNKKNRKKWEQGGILGFKSLCLSCGRVTMANNNVHTWASFLAAAESDSGSSGFQPKAATLPLPPRPLLVQFWVIRYLWG